MRSFEEINELLDKVGERLERTERIVNANSGGYAETREILKELAKSSKEFDKSSKEFDKRSKEFDKRSKEFDERSKEFDERSKEFDERFKNNGDDFERIKKNLDKIAEDLKDVSSRSKGNGDSIGIIAEEFFMETTKEGLHIGAFGHLEQKTCNYIIYDSDKNKSVEFDIVFTNDDFIFIVEVKYRLDKKHTACFTEQKEKGVDKGLNRLEIFEKYDEKWIGDRTIVTAFACLGAKKRVIEAFKKKGYYVLVRVPNDTYKLFSPR